MDELEQDIVFVNPPTYDPNCPVCFELLKDAYQTTCCGNHICSNCTERLKCTPNVKCPQCRDDNFEANEDKFFSSQLLKLRVRCYYHKEGCTWTGELCGLEQHVTMNCNRGMDEPEEDIEFINPPPYDYKCPFCSKLLRDSYQTTCCGNHICSECTKKLKPNFKCPQCQHDNFKANEDKFFSRQLLNLKVHCYYHKEGCTWTGELRGLEQHVTTNCNKGVIKCKHCNSQCADEAAVEEHLPICGEIPIDCPNKCSNSQYKRKDMQHHLETECPLCVIVHSKGSIPYTANKIVQTVPLSFTMTNYMDYLESRDPWFSPPFYTHKQGYKIHLRVDANLHEQGNVSVVAFTTKGEYDHLLQWPLRAEIEVGLLNWRVKRYNIKTLYLSGDYFCSQIPTEKLAEWGKGIINFIPNEELWYDPGKNTEYLQHNCLSFQVRRVTILPNIVPDLPLWAIGKCLCQFTIISFTQIKQRKASFYGPPFYTNLRGYKLIVSAFNDFNMTKGTYMSLHARLMKGEYDDTLAWPFTGDVVVEILNWREDKNHQKYTFSFHNGLKSTSINRVLNIDIAQSGCQQIVPYSALPYNHSTNTEFLRNDCIHIKVKSVDVYSSHNILKSPFWRHPSHDTQELCHFVLTHFTKRIQHKTIYFSDPFENGYRMQLKVNPDEDGHVGIHVYLMKGPIDEFLPWPFHGDVVVELLNWREDNGHHSRVIELSSNVSNSACSRITTGERGSVSWGNSQFIQHSALEYNPYTNTQYLQDDCLLFRVKDVIVHSSEFSQKCPWWQNPQTVSPYLEFNVTNFSKRKDLGSTYISSAFLTHYQGYKMRLEVEAERRNETYYVSVNARLLKGDNDDNLVWPFEADIFVQLLNWRQNINHYDQTISFDRKTPDYFSGRVAIGEAALGCCSAQQSILCSKLRYDNTTNTEYLQNDCLRFKVKEVVVYSTPHCSKSPIWQNQKPSKFFEFTITQFSHHIRLKNAYFSPPFYTSAYGYKMCLKVYAAGNEGTHVAIYGYLMKGEYDDFLSWPFCADIVIDILNWNGDHNHHRKVLSFDDSSPDNARARVYDDGLAPQGYGNSEVIPISTLFPRYASNTEYLEDNCMRIRVYDIAIYNTPLLNKTPRWQNSWFTTSPWLQFTVTGFYKRKIYDSEYISPPFYTHKNGYKMRLEANPNGYGDGKGTHLSIFACLLKGENDYNLKWPMNIDISIQLINWRKDDSHILHVIHFANAVSGARNQVMGTKEKADSSWGNHKFCAHSTLYTATRDVQYIEDDCILLRVRGVIIHSRKGFFS